MYEKLPRYYKHSCNTYKNLTKVMGLSMIGSVNNLAIFQLIRLAPVSPPHSKNRAPPSALAPSPSPHNYTPESQ